MNEAPPVNSGASKIKKLLGRALLAIIVAMLSITILFVGGCLAMPLLVIHQADAGFRKAKKTINPERLRNWALESIKNYSGTNSYSQHIPASQIPDYLKNLYSTAPEMAWVNPKTADSEGSVAVIWGGGFFHWGFFVGSTNFSITEFPDHQIAQWTSGIYYTHEGNCKIR